MYDFDIYTGKSGIDEGNPLVAVGLGSRVVVKFYFDFIRNNPKRRTEKVSYLF